jgi:enoyl-[acyl-carrier protein] reductase/trans-2-enoyl-CoA reductase (NAD+)
MRSDVQEKIAELWQAATTENLADLGDLEGYRFS